MRRYYRDKKDRVEDCLILSIFQLKKLGMLKEDCSKVLTWQGRWPEDVDKVSASVNLSNNINLTLRYSTIDKNGVKIDHDCFIPLKTTKCHFGGLRYWFVCPAEKNGTYCGRMVGKLYKLRSERYFKCRHCYDLSYYSRNESRLGRFGRMGYPIKAQRQIDEIQQKIKRFVYNNKLTKKAQRCMKISAKIDEHLLKDETLK